MNHEAPLPIVGLLMTLCVVVGALGVAGWWWTNAGSSSLPTEVPTEITEKKPHVHREAALLFVNYSPAEASAVRNPHLYKGRPLCQRCHVQNTASLTASPVALCKACHQGEHIAHPVDVSQLEPMARPLRLGPGGALLCHTCHSHHDVYRHEHGLVLEGDTLCTVCHVTTPSPARGGNEGESAQP